MEVRTRGFSLTRKQRELYEWVSAFVEREGRSPTLSEAAAEFQRTKGTMSVRMRALRAKGAISGWDGEGGWPSKAGRYRRVLEWLHDARLFPLEVSGLLPEYGIPDGSLCLFEAKARPMDRELVAWMGGVYQFVRSTDARTPQEGSLMPASADGMAKWAGWTKEMAGVGVAGVLRCVVQWRGPWPEPGVRGVEGEDLGKFLEA